MNTHFFYLNLLLRTKADMAASEAESRDLVAQADEAIRKMRALRNESGAASVSLQRKIKASEPPPPLQAPQPPAPPPRRPSSRAEALRMRHRGLFGNIHGFESIYIHMPRRSPDRLDLLQGTLDLLILQTLRRGEQHGYGISQAIRAGSNDLLQVETGSLYPALHRIEKRGWISSSWSTSEKNQRAKYYRLSADGKRQLELERSRWNKMVEAMAALMNPQGTEA